MTSSIRLENENLGSHHFDAQRERDEALALEDVRLKEEELQNEAMHAFDDLLDGSGSEASSYYKPPSSQHDNGNLHDELYIQSQRDNANLRAENGQLQSKITELSEKCSRITRENKELTVQLEKSEVRMNLLEQEIGELSDTQTVHRVKDQYETIIEKLKSGFSREKSEILAQLTKFKEEAMQSRNHICSTQDFDSSKQKELESLRNTVEELRQKELDLQLMIKEKSMLLKEQDRGDSPSMSDENLNQLCSILRVEFQSSREDMMNDCIRKVVDLNNQLEKLTLDIENKSQTIENYKMTAAILDKENTMLREKVDHMNSSDTESHSETTRLGTLKNAVGKLESENLQLKLQLRTIEDKHNRLQIEMKNRINEDSKTLTQLHDLTKEKQRLHDELQRVQVNNLECRRSQEMAEEMLKNQMDSFEIEKARIRRDIEAVANKKLQDEVHRMELQLAHEVSQRSEIVDRLRKTCGAMLEERLAKICQEKDAEIIRVTDQALKDAEKMHEQLTVLQDECEELRRELRDAQSDKSKLNLRFSKATEDIEDLRDELHEKQEKLNRLRSQFEDLKLDCEAKTGELIERDKKLRLMESLVKTSKQRLDKASKDRELLEEEYRSKLEKNAQELKKSDDRIAQLQLELEDIAERAAEPKNDEELQITVTKLNSELLNSRDQCNKATEQVELLREQLKLKIEVMLRVKGDLVSVQDQGRKYAAERQKLIAEISRLEQDMTRRQARDADLRNAMSLITEKVIERLSARNRFSC